MFGFGKEKDKSPIDNLFEAYKLGGMPLALVILGTLCLLVPPSQSISDGNIVDPVAAFVVGGGIVLVGGITWAIALQQRTRFQIAVFDLLAEVSRQAATSPKDGANFKVAIEQFTGELPKLLMVMTAPQTQPQNGEKAVKD